MVECVNLFDHIVEKGLHIPPFKFSTIQVLWIGIFPFNLSNEHEDKLQDQIVCKNVCPPSFSTRDVCPPRNKQKCNTWTDMLYVYIQTFCFEVVFISQVQLNILSRPHYLCRLHFLCLLDLVGKGLKTNFLHLWCFFNAKIQNPGQTIT